MTANGVLDNLTPAQTFQVEVTPAGNGTLAYRVSLLGLLPEQHRQRASADGYDVPEGFTVWYPVTSFTAPAADDDLIEQAAIEHLTQLRRLGHLLPTAGAQLPLDMVLRLPSGEVRRHRPEAAA